MGEGEEAQEQEEETRPVNSNATGWVNLQKDILEDFVETAHQHRVVKLSLPKTTIVEGEDPRVKARLKMETSKRSLRRTDARLRTLRAVRRMLGITRPWYDA